VVVAAAVVVAVELVVVLLPVAREESRLGRVEPLLPVSKVVAAFLLVAALLRRTKHRRSGLAESHRPNLLRIAVDVEVAVDVMDVTMVHRYSKVPWLLYKCPRIGGNRNQATMPLWRPRRKSSRFSTK
jgi:hypothetical protein